MVQEKTLMPGTEYRIMNGEGITLQTVVHDVMQRAEYFGAPLANQADQVKSGGMLFGSTEECAILYHPSEKTYLRYVVRVRKQGRYAFITVNKTNGHDPNSAIGAGMEAGRAAGRGKAKQEQDGWYLMIDDVFEDLFNS